MMGGRRANSLLVAEMGRSVLRPYKYKERAHITFSTGNARRDLDLAILGFEPAGGVLGVVGEDDVGSGALDGGEDFEGDALFVDPAIAGGGFYHGEFAADVIGPDGDVESFAD